MPYTMIARKSLSLPVSLVLSFGFGMIFGVAVQKYYGLGNLLRTAGINDHRPSPRAFTPSRIPVNVSDELPEAVQGKLSLFILAGQSNMSGRGALPAEQAINSRVFVFGNDYRWHLAREPIDAPDGQVDEVSLDLEAGYGPGLAFALSLLQRSSVVAIGLIPCAKGSTSIAEWQRHLSDRTLYGSCLKRVRAATTMGEVAGVLFFQGETDAVDPDWDRSKSPAALAYAHEFGRFINDLRGDLSLPNLPLVYAQIGTNTAPQLFPNWDVVKAQQETVELPCAAMIRTDDLPLRDTVHFTMESFRTIGARYAEAVSKLTDSVGHCR